MKCWGVLGLAVCLGSVPDALQGQTSGRQAINPPSLPPPRGYSHVVENLGRALRAAGASWSDVVAATMYVTDLSRLDVLREVRARYLPPEAPPASTLVQVVALVRPELMIEVAVEAVIPAGGR